MKYLVVVLPILAAACAGAPTESVESVTVPATLADPVKPAPPSSCDAFAPLSVTLRDQAGDALGSDAGGAYVEGVNGVEAHINDPTGNLSIWTTESSRFLVATHGGGSVNVDRVYTNTHSSSCGLRLSSLPTNSTAVLEAEERAGGTGGTVSVVRYGRSCSGQVTGTPATITRTNPTTIVISAASGVYCTKNKNKFVSAGTVGPFEMTIVAQ